MVSAIREKVDELANRGARLLTTEWRQAAELLEQAHALAVTDSDDELTAILSALVGRSYWVGKQLGPAIHAARRCMFEDIRAAGGPYTLRVFLDAASRRASERVDQSGRLAFLRRESKAASRVRRAREHRAERHDARGANLFELPMHVAASESPNGRCTAERVIDAGGTVSVGAARSNATLVVPRWRGPTVPIIVEGRWLQLSPGMRVHMCDEIGEQRVVGTYEELLAHDYEFPLEIRVSSLKIAVPSATEGGARLSVFVRFMADAALEGA